jgi:secretion/DNA translocation related CpaE-like protein
VAGRTDGDDRRAAGSGPGPAVLVVTDDPLLARHVLAVVAAVGLEPDQADGDEAVRRAWRAAGAVLVGRDRADQVARLTLPARSEVYVVGHDDDQAGTALWSTRLRAAVATLPDGGADLAAALSRLRTAAREAAVLALVGGSGGVGTSTLSAALALRAARDGRRVLLLDADTLGGGLDVLLGAEDLAGWRWSHLRGARGHLGDLVGQLPHCEGVDVLAVDREARSVEPPSPEALAAVLASAVSSHDLVVADLPRFPAPSLDAVLTTAATVLLVARADVRGVASADTVARGLAPRCRDLQVVVRGGRGHRLDPGLVADALDLPLAGTWEDDPALPLAAERGDPPARPGRSALTRLCRRLLGESEAA